MRARPAFIALGLLFVTGCGSVTDGEPVEITVPPGSSVAAVAESLQARGVIASARWFRIRARFKGVDRSLKPGVYSLKPGQSLEDILSRLELGAELKRKVTLPEGSTLWDFARIVEKSLGIPADSVWAAARDSSIRASFGIPGQTVEGFLLPDTYEFGKYATARQVVDAFLTGRAESWPQGWKAEVDSVGLSKSEVLALASIVEAEAQLRDEIPRIASVYLNRLRLGIPLQADPTINYAYLLDTGQRKNRLFNKDYEYKSAYNTYLHAGLPPTPIGNPSTAAVDAVLSPLQTNDLYFVARGDGGHTFASSYAQHLRNIRTIRR